jgi:lysophospholipase L1-like esterase
VFDRLVADAAWLAEAEAGDGAHPGAGGYAALAGIVHDHPHWHALLRSS